MSRLGSKLRPAPLCRGIALSLAHVLPRLIGLFRNRATRALRGARPLAIPALWGDYGRQRTPIRRHVYRDVLIALDEAKGINNGQPSMWAYFLDQLGICSQRSCSPSRLWHRLLHRDPRRTRRLPAGKSPPSKSTQAIAEQARIALLPWPQVAVVHGDGSSGPFEAADVIVACAGATHPQPSWLAALKPGGRLLFPLTPAKGPGAMAFLTRKNENCFDARLYFGVFFIAFSGARDPEISQPTRRCAESRSG